MASWIRRFIWRRAAILCHAVSIPSDGCYSPPDLAPAAVRQKTLDAIEACFVRAAAERPVLAVFEDAHWVDPTSREMLERLIERLPSLPGLLIVTARPEFAANWLRLPHATAVTLNHLGHRAARQLIASVATGRGLPSHTIDQILSRTQGNPLYVEEITKSILESGVESAAGPGAPAADGGAAIPATLRDSLMARLDRLGSAKEIAQAAAVIGRQFDDALLSEIVAVPDAARAAALEQLTGTQLVARGSDEPRAGYEFRHVLIQETAYQSLLNATRRAHHRRIAEALERRFAELAATEPEMVAHHFTAAGDGLRAVPYWHRAGQHAAQRSANLEAIEHLTKGLELVRKQPASPERAANELSLLIALGPALMPTRGWNAREVKEALFAGPASRGGNRPLRGAVSGGLGTMVSGSRRRRWRRGAHAVARVVRSVARR